MKLLLALFFALPTHAQTAPNQPAPTDPIAQSMTAPNQVITIPPATGPHTTYLPTFDGTVLHDFVPSYEGNRYRNCPYHTAAFNAGLLDLNTCAWDHVTFTTQAGAPTAHQALKFFSLYSYGPSSNYSSNWRITDLFNLKMIVANRGIANAQERSVQKRAAGDLNIQDDYIWTDGGFNSQSDEGAVGHRLYINQTLEYWQGTSLSAGIGLTLPLLSDSITRPTNSQPDSNHTIDGGYLLNITKGTLSGTVTGPSGQLTGSGYLNTLPVSIKLPTTTAWGIVPGTIPNFYNPGVNTPFTVTVTLKAGAFTAGGTVWVAGPNYPEQAPITAVSVPRDGKQSITLAVRNPQLTAGANIFQGGIGGQCLSLDAQIGHDSLNQTYGRTSYPAFGSLDGTNLVYGYFPQGTSSAMPSPDAQLFNPGKTGLNGFHLYPCAEIVANLSLQHDPKLEPNSIPFSLGDHLESPLPTAVLVQGSKIACGTAMAPGGMASVCSEITIGGPGATSNVVALKINNANPAAYYNGTSLAPPLGLWFTGHWSNAIQFEHWPKSALLNVRNMGLDGTTKAQVLSFPHGQAYWDDLNRVLSTDGLGSVTYLGPPSAAAGACTRATAGRRSWGQDGKDTWCNPATLHWEDPRLATPTISPAPGPMTYACFDSTHQLISSPTPCTTP